jgi:VWFA-related protein
MMKCVLALALTVSLAAQEPRFEVQSRLVLVPVTITDSKGHTVEDLDPSDFVLLDDGRPQKVAVDNFSTGVAPIALVVAVQSSGISAAVLAKVQKIGAMIQPVIAGERGCAALVSFDYRIQWLQECTGDSDALDRAFLRLRTGEFKQARMLDAAHEAIEDLRRRPNVRRVLLLISESRDRGSETALEAIAIDAQTAGVTVYAATYSAMKTGLTAKASEYVAPPPPTSALRREDEMERPPSRRRPHVPPPEYRVDLRAAIGELARLGTAKTTEILAGITGGTEFSFARQRGLEDAIEKLGAELHTQYVLSFTPQSPETGYHPLVVQVTRPGNFQIRTRPGYWSAGVP